MKNQDYCHLHNHTEYSQLDGLGTTENYAKRAAELKFKYLACTDHGNIDGLIKFQKSCIENKIKPILGCELYIVQNIEVKEKKRSHVTVFVKNQKGFNNLCSLLTKANLDGFYYRPRIDFDMLLNSCEGLIVSTACASTFVRSKEGEELFYKLHEKIKDDLYCEIMPHKLDVQYEVNKKVIGLSKKVGCKVIVTNDCHYINQLDEESHEILLAIQTKKNIYDKTRFKFNVKELYLKSANKMIKSLKEINFYKKEYLTNTLEIAEKCCDYIIPKKNIVLPKIKGVPKQENKFLYNICKEGFEEKFGKSIATKKTYKARLKEEFNLIKSKKFTRYFLIVWELVNWCKKNNILIGPGRGSAGGSLVAYLMGITSVDPIKYNLLFSRFINKDRIDFPDIDIDFEYKKRHLIRQHWESMYGENNVAGISSFNRMKARAVIKDVARVFAVNHMKVNQFTKLIEDDDIQTAIDKYPEAKEFEEQYPEVIRHAKALEGQVRNTSTHAAALVLSKKSIMNSGKCNLYKRDDTLLINWEKEDAEHSGFVKFDILGLKLLSILAETRDRIEENYGVIVDFEKINLEDEKVFEEINNGHTVGIFQLSPWPTTRLIKESRIENFKHISDIIALVRPGPMNSGMTAKYIERKNGQHWERNNEIYEKITESTYGVICYQEQIMEAIVKMAGLPYSTADKIRQIIAKKKDKKLFKKYEKTFVDGCIKENTFNKQEAQEFWKGLEEHAKYSFNLSHSIEYSMLSYWCVYLKVYYPTEFICSSLTFGSKDKKQELVEEAYRIGLKLQLPKIGISDYEKWISKGKQLYIPFKEIKGLGETNSLQVHIPIEVNEVNSFFDTFNEKKKKRLKRHKGKIGNILNTCGAYFNKKYSLSKKDLRDLKNFNKTSHEVQELFDFEIR